MSKCEKIPKVGRRKSNPELTEAEWIIMKVVWENEPCAAGTVQEILQKSKNWAYSTVKGAMDRMVEKGFLENLPGKFAGPIFGKDEGFDSLAYVIGVLCDVEGGDADLLSGSVFQRVVIEDQNLILPLCCDLFVEPLICFETEPLVLHHLIHEFRG